MCGRYILASSAEAIAEHFQVGQVPAIAPRYNIAPTQQAPVVRVARSGEREIVLLRWGLVPFWAKDLSIGQRQINARAESLATRSAFREAYRRRRCLVPVDGFYEWQRGGRRKQPYLCRMPGGGVFALAGLWERWRSAEGEVVETFTIVTADAVAPVRRLHDRMPVVIPEQRYDEWLRAPDPDGLLLLPAPVPLVVEPVGLAVNNVRNEGPELVVPIEAGSEGLV
jgi:putative SOS response-associated peptidase YedK